MCKLIEKKEMLRLVIVLISCFAIAVFLTSPSLSIYMVIPLSFAIVAIYGFIEKLKKETLDKLETTGLVCIVILNVITVSLIWNDRVSSNHQKLLENYNYFNRVYDEWYSEMPDRFKNIDNDKEWAKISFDSLNNEEEAWIRRYFNLYSQEYYFYKEKMIPKDMWLNLIHGEKCEGAAMRNFKKYPILLEGYEYWKNNRSFNHPKGFTKMLDHKIKDCSEFLNIT